MTDGHKILVDLRYIDYLLHTHFLIVFNSSELVQETAESDSNPIGFQVYLQHVILPSFSI